MKDTFVPISEIIKRVIDRLSEPEQGPTEEEIAAFKRSQEKSTTGEHHVQK